MTTPLKQVQPVLAFAAAHLDEDLSLDALAREAGLSAFHLHRVFSSAAGETPKEYTMRLRVGRAAVMLLTSDDSVLDVALACGFQSHEVFCRTFRRRFGITPSAYRERGFADRVDRAQARNHTALVTKVSPCVGLYHSREGARLQRNNMAYSITIKELSPQPVLTMRRRVNLSDLAKALAEMFGHVYAHAQRNGIALAGQPLTRYLEWGPGLCTIEAGMPVTAAGSVPAEAEVRADTLPGGPVATATHTGPYDKLSDAHAAIQQWIEAEGLRTAGAPWEVYVTDPAEYPDPKDWKTELFWPVVR